MYIFFSVLVDQAAEKSGWVLGKYKSYIIPSYTLLGILINLEVNWSYELYLLDMGNELLFCFNT